MTLKTLSQELGLSVTTISDALKDTPSGYVAPQTRERVQAAAARLGYRPNLHARRLVTRRATNVVGIYSNIMPTYELQLTKLNAVQRALAAQGYEQNLAIGGVEALGRLARQNPAGLIVFNWPGGQGIEEKLLLSPIHHETQVVLLDVAPQEASAQNRVIFDRCANTRLATQHLLELGHRRLGIFLDPDHLPRGERARGVHQALSAFGLREDAVRFYETGTFAGFDTGRLIAEQWLAERDSDRPTGLVLLNDETSAGFLTRVQTAGIRVPDDVSVVGHDNRAWSPHLSVPLTTVTHPAEKIAEAAVALLLERLTGTYSGPSREITIGSELVLRASTAPPSEGA
jgi:DNA-binding LacI/PurR family transcriptional regulator